jgi:hypothetical protein
MCQLVCRVPAINMNMGISDMSERPRYLPLTIYGPTIQLTGKELPALKRCISFSDTCRSNHDKRSSLSGEGHSKSSRLQMGAELENFREVVVSALLGLLPNIVYQRFSTNS